MRFFIRSLLCVVMLALAAHVLSASPVAAQEAAKPYPAAAVPYGIDAKRPVFGGACMACPWGMLGIATMQALAPYGYEVQMCWVCHSVVGPRLMADRKKPDVSGGNQSFVASPMTQPSPNALLDISATSESNLIDAWNGSGEYTKDNTKRQNYRVVAAIQLPNYLWAAARNDTGIKSLADIKDHKKALWIYVDGHNATTQALLKFYGITEEALKAHKGGFISNVNREMRAGADVIIHHGLLTNTPEQRVWYEATQLSDLTFMDLDPALITTLAKMPGYYAATTPAFTFRGLDKRVNTVMRRTHYIYVRDDAPDAFVYTLTKALDEQSFVFSQQAQPFYYDTKRVAKTITIPLHPAAARYYREVGYLK